MAKKRGNPDIARHASKGGRATYRKYGSEHMAAIGKRGFEVTTARHFGGDVEAHKKWLGDRGKWEYFQIYGRWASKPKPVHPKGKG